MSNNNQYKKLHPNISSILNYSFPSYGDDLLEELILDILSRKIKMQSIPGRDEEKQIVDVHTTSVYGQSLLLGRYRVRREGNEIILEEVKTVGEKKPSEYIREIKKIPVKKF